MSMWVVNRWRLFCVLVGLRYGLGAMTIEHHIYIERQVVRPIWPSLRLRIFVDGHDVTENCRYADEDNGAELYVKNDRGRTVFNVAMDGPLTEWRRPIEWRLVDENQLTRLVS